MTFRVKGFLLTFWQDTTFSFFMRNTPSVKQQLQVWITLQPAPQSQLLASENTTISRTRCFTFI
jgi:hypothetical protein